MTRFDAQALEKILAKYDILDKNRYHPTLLISLGYYDQNEPMVVPSQELEFHMMTLPKKSNFKVVIPFFQ